MARTPKKAGNDAAKGQNPGEAEVVLEEPGDNDAPGTSDRLADRGVWMRGLYMLLVAILTSVAGSLLGISALLQFGWLLFTGHRNDHIAAFGADLADWLSRAALFQTAKSEQKPFPWTQWGKR